jgi:hypothetical protein
LRLKKWKRRSAFPCCQKRWKWRRHKKKKSNNQRTKKQERTKSFKTKNQNQRRKVLLERGWEILWWGYWCCWWDYRVVGSVWECVAKVSEWEKKSNQLGFFSFCNNNNNDNKSKE